MTAVDETRLDDLVDDVGDVAFAADTVRMFLTALDGRVADLRRAVRDRDRTATVATAHPLASTGALVGAVGLAALCRRLEVASPADRTAVADTLRELTEESERVTRGLTDWLRRHSDA